MDQATKTRKKTMPHSPMGLILCLNWTGLADPNLGQTLSQKKNPASDWLQTPSRPSPAVQGQKEVHKNNNNSQAYNRPLGQIPPALRDQSLVGLARSKSPCGANLGYLGYEGLTPGADSVRSYCREIPQAMRPPSRP